jgi:hypothetical protein
MTVSITAPLGLERARRLRNRQPQRAHQIVEDVVDGICDPISAKLDGHVTIAQVVGCPEQRMPIRRLGNRHGFNGGLHAHDQSSAIVAKPVTVAQRCSSGQYHRDLATVVQTRTQSALAAVFETQGELPGAVTIPVVVPYFLAQIDHGQNRK